MAAAAYHIVPSRSKATIFGIGVFADILTAVLGLTGR
jgi:hypothetical protein